MQYSTAKGFSGWTALGMLIIFLVAGFIVAAIFQFIISYGMLPAGTSFDKLPAALEAAMKDERNVNSLRIMQVGSTFLMLCIPTILFSRLVNGRSYFWMGFNKHINITQILVAFGIIFLANIMAGPVADASKALLKNLPAVDAMAHRLEQAYNEQVQVLSNLKSWGEYIAAIFIMAFFPALFEEMFFRGALQQHLEKWWKRPLLAISITAIIFSLIHFSIYHFLTRFVLGFVLGLLYHKTRNLWVNIIAHFLNNALAVTQLFFLSRQKTKPNIAELEPTVAWWLGLLALAAVIFLFWYLQKITKQTRAAIALQEQSLLATSADPFGTITKQD